MIRLRKSSPCRLYRCRNSLDADMRLDLSSEDKRRGTHLALHFVIFSSSRIILLTVNNDARTSSAMARIVTRRSTSRMSRTCLDIDVETARGLPHLSLSPRLCLPSRNRPCHLKTSDLLHVFCDFLEVERFV